MDSRDVEQLRNICIVNAMVVEAQIRKEAMLAANRDAYEASESTVYDEEDFREMADTISWRNICGELNR